MNPLFQPFTEANKRLQNEVAPEAYINPTPKPKYTMVVIGAGPAGLVTAAGCAGLGASVALVEKHALGGDCLNVGCVPSKALVHAADVVRKIKSSNDLGISVDNVKVDFEKVMEKVRELRADIAPHDSVKRFSELGVDVFLGKASFTSPSTVQVDEEITLNFSRCCIATGARAAVLPISGLKEAGCLTNETIWSLTSLPKRLAVIGAGPIGCELAQAFQMLGSQVHIFEVANQVLIREDADAAKVIQDQLVKDGVTLHLGAKLQRVSQASLDSPKTLEVEEEESLNTYEVDQVFCGVGRIPNVEDLNLKAAQVKFSKTGITVNDKLQTSNTSVYAAGDVASRYQFTHAADFMARLVIRNALFLGSSSSKDLTFPWCTYTYPQLAHIGLTEQAAKAQGIELDTYTKSFDDLDRAIVDSQPKGGFIKIHARKGKDKVVGATIVVPGVGSELISTISILMKADVSLKTLASCISPYPSYSELIRQVGDLYNKTRLTPLTSWFLKTMMPS